MIDRILRGFQQTTGFYSSPLYSKLFAFLLLLIACLGSRGVKSQKIGWPHICTAGFAGFFLYFFNDWLLRIHAMPGVRVAWYAATLFAGYLLMLTAGIWMWRLLRHNLLDDVFNDENESFMQETRLIENEYSVNLPTLFRYQGRTWQGWLNIPAVFRAVAVIGSPGSGKSFTVINNFIRQFIEKSFCLYIYDFKYPDLSTLAYNHLLRYKDRYEVTPQFCVIN
ncbi:YWFCY domain-containing protein, partial [Alistipes putredinis]|uniref:YWFCY domain-containing protein n=1 Tax=Alistipes putredinis TaxID=28117 RepID=UPI003AAFDE3B